MFTALNSVACTFVVCFSINTQFSIFRKQLINLVRSGSADMQPIKHGSALVRIVSANILFIYLFDYTL